MCELPLAASLSFPLALALAQRSRSRSVRPPCRYIVSPRDIVVAQPRDAKDKIMWAKNAGHFSLALKLCKEYPGALSSDAVAVIGEMYLTALTSDQLPPDQQNFPLAASLCPDLLGDDMHRWDQWVMLFILRGQVCARCMCALRNDE